MSAMNKFNFYLKVFSQSCLELKNFSRRVVWSFAFHFQVGRLRNSIAKFENEFGFMKKNGKGAYPNRPCKTG
jgi:hypothetical protein